VKGREKKVCERGQKRLGETSGKVNSLQKWGTIVLLAQQVAFKEGAGGRGGVPVKGHRK